MITLREEGLVIEACPGARTAKVKIQRRAMCESCGKCGLMSKTMTDIVVNARNDAGATLGQRVFVELPSRDVMLTAFIVYIVPLLAAAAGYAAGGLVHAVTFGTGTLVSRQSVEIVSGLIFFAGSFAVIRICDRKAARSGRLLPLITEVIDESMGGYQIDQNYPGYFSDHPCQEAFGGSSDGIYDEDRSSDQKK